MTQVVRENLLMFDCAGFLVYLECELKFDSGGVAS